MTRNCLPALALAAMLVACCGAHCVPRRDPAAPLPPAVFAAPPTREQLIAFVNGQSERVRQLQADSVTLSTPGLPALRGDLAWERHRKFRLRAGLLGIGGPDLDLGSNDDLFWMWMRYNSPPSVYYARHDEFAQSPMRGLLPIDPGWIVEALGLASFDPAGHHEGPFVRDDGRVEMRTHLASPTGPLTKLTVLDGRSGLVLEQRLYNQRGEQQASAVASGHQFYPEVGVSLPNVVQIDCPPARLSFQLTVARYAINQLAGDPAQLWTLPRMDGVRYLDLTRVDLGPPPAFNAAAFQGAAFQEPGFPGASPQGMGPRVDAPSLGHHPRQGFRPIIRGLRPR